MHSKGSRGQATIHPDVVEMRMLERHVSELAEGLLGMPRLGGWQVGRGRAADRQYRPPRRGGKLIALSSEVERALADAESR